MDTERAKQLIAEIVNAVMIRRVLLDGTKVANVPTTGIGVFARSTIAWSDNSCSVELEVTVTNELDVELTQVVLECPSFTNSSMTALAFVGPLELVAGSPQAMPPGTSLEYRARYVTSEQDFADDGLLICSLRAQGYSEAGEWAIGQDDAWIELGGYSAMSLSLPRSR